MLGHRKDQHFLIALYFSSSSWHFKFREHTRVTFTRALSLYYRSHQSEPPICHWPVWPHRHSAFHCRSRPRWWRRGPEDLFAFLLGFYSCASFHTVHCIREKDSIRGKKCVSVLLCVYMCNLILPGSGCGFARGCTCRDVWILLRIQFVFNSIL